MRPEQLRLEGESAEDHLPASPPLKWAGGKRWLVPTIRRKWLPFMQLRFVEPFSGGLAIALNLRPRIALLNDINPHLINFYRQVQKGLTIDLEWRNEEKKYYRYRELFNQLIRDGQTNSKEAAELFYFLNRTCFNGLCRFNQSGEFNVPWGKYRRPHHLKDLNYYRPIFKNWEFTCGDFGDLEISNKDFIYADPPYDVEFTHYAKEGFTLFDQERLATWISGHNGPAIISNQMTGDMRRLYQQHKFKLLRRIAPRMISCDGDRTKAWEVLALHGFGSPA